MPIPFDAPPPRVLRILRKVAKPEPDLRYWCCRWKPAATSCPPAAVPSVPVLSAVPAGTFLARSFRHNGQRDETLSNQGTTHYQYAKEQSSSARVGCVSNSPKAGKKAYLIVETMPTITRQYPDIVPIFEVDEADRASDTIVDIRRIWTWYRYRYR